MTVKRHLLVLLVLTVLFTRRRVYMAFTFLLLLYIFVLGAVDYLEPRIYAIVYPLGPVLVVGFLVAVWEKLPSMLRR